MVTTPYCLPEHGTLEITAEGYRYSSQSIERECFDDNESRYRILVEVGFVIFSFFEGGYVLTHD